MFLSKLQGSAERIRSSSDLLSNEKRTTWSPMFLTLKPDLDLHRGVKVLAMASIFKGRLVRNLATIPCSVVTWSLLRHRPGPSISERDRELQCLERKTQYSNEQPDVISRDKLILMPVSRWLGIASLS